MKGIIVSGAMAIGLLAILPADGNAGECYEDMIVKPSPFMGNNGEIFVLSNGTVWEVMYEYEYLYEYQPSIIVCPTAGYIVVEEKKLNVQQIK